MKTITGLLLITMLPVFTDHLGAQVGIGTTTPDASSILDVYSTNKGFLLPKLTGEQRDAIGSPATGLMVFNLGSNDIEVNKGTPASPVWAGTQSNPAPSVFSLTETGDVTTSSVSSEPVPGMTLSPETGSYLVLFNGQYGLVGSVPISTSQGVIDLQAAYDELMALTATNTTHSTIFGNGEVLAPGVYDLAAATSVAGTLTLDGGGDANALFVIRVVGAFSTGANTTVILTGGARAENIFWISQGALSLAAMTIMKGTLIANNAAVSAAADTDLEGRMFSTTGAISFGPGTAYIPEGSYVDLGVLSTFVMFTSSGAVANTEPSDITGDVGTNLGAISGFSTLDGNMYGPGAAPNPVNNTLVTFSLYQNGVLIPNSSRTSDVNTSVIALQAMATISAGQAISVWWNVDEGPVQLGNRILTVVKAD